MEGKRKWVAAAALVGIFVAGIVVGVVAAGAYVHHRLGGLHAHGPAGMHHIGVEWLDWELDLSPAQEEAIGRVLNDVHMDLFRFKSEHNDELEQLVTAGLERVDAELTDEQLRKWAPIRARIADHAATTIDDVMGD